MQLNADQIQRILPQSYPFVMIDRVVDFQKGESLTAVKNITGNEWIFEGQACQTGVFPETLLIEAAAQAAILFYRLNKEEQSPKSKIFLGRAKAEFFKLVHIGDQLKLKTASHKMLATSGYMDIHASVNEADVANFEIMYSVIK